VPSAAVRLHVSGGWERSGFRGFVPWSRILHGRTIDLGDPSWSEEVMAGETRHKSRTSDLNPDLLATPFGKETNWHVITGAPSCGKTTLIGLLADEGFRTVTEAARQFIEKEMSDGCSIDEMHERGAALQQRLLDIKLSMEDSLLPAAVSFLDDAVPGSISWYRLFGLNPNTALSHCFQHRYASVFVLDPLPLELDGIRFEDDFTGILDEWIEHDYTALGYAVVRVPVMTPEARLRYILERVPHYTT